MQAIQEHERTLALILFEGLKKMPGVRVYGPDFENPLRAPTVAFRIDGRQPKEVARHLGESGFFVWDGHFYAIRAMEVLGLAGSGGVVRVGMSIYVGEEDVRLLVEEIERLVREGH